MKTILRIIMILLVAGVVAGAFSLAVNSNSTTSGTTVTSSNGQPLARPEGGDHEGGSSAEGLGGVLTTILKLTGITILVLMLQKGFSQLGNLKWKFAQR
jgi:hypothetical protein